MRLFCWLNSDVSWSLTCTRRSVDAAATAGTVLVLRVCFGSFICGATACTAVLVLALW